MPFTLKKKILSITFLILFLFTSIFIFTGQVRDGSQSYFQNKKLSDVSSKLFINGTLDWIALKNAGNCTGQGTYADPYLIEDLTINGKFSGTCIWIENSDVYFRIENCTTSYAGNYGIYFYNVSNGYIINNTFSYNYFEGVRLEASNNNSILLTNVYGNTNGIRIVDGHQNNLSENHIFNNDFISIGVSNSNNTIIQDNLIESDDIGIDLWNSNNSTISRNDMRGSGLRISGNLKTLSSTIIDMTNLVNGKTLYYYINEFDLNSNNFTNAGQVILVDCNSSNISNLDVSLSSRGISLYYSNNNYISENIANSNLYGICLEYSNNNTLTGNTVNNNIWNGIDIFRSNNNTLNENTVNQNNVGISLWKCNHSVISRNSVNYNSFYGIWLEESNNNSILINTARENYIGLLLDTSNYNIITNNLLTRNEICISEIGCEENYFESNICDETISIASFNLIYLFGIICTMILVLYTKISKKNK